MSAGSTRLREHGARQLSHIYIYIHIIHNITNNIMNNTSNNIINNNVPFRAQLRSATGYEQTV